MENQLLFDSITATDNKIFIHEKYYYVLLLCISIIGFIFSYYITNLFSQFFFSFMFFGTIGLKYIITKSLARDCEIMQDYLEEPAKANVDKPINKWDIILNKVNWGILASLFFALICLLFHK